VTIAVFETGCHIFWTSLKKKAGSSFSDPSQACTASISGLLLFVTRSFCPKLRSHHGKSAPVGSRVQSSRRVPLIYTYKFGSDRFGETNVTPLPAKTQPTVHLSAPRGSLAEESGSRGYAGNFSGAFIYEVSKPVASRIGHFVQLPHRAVMLFGSLQFLLCAQLGVTKRCNRPPRK